MAGNTMLFVDIFNSGENHFLCLGIKAKIQETKMEYLTFNVTRKLRGIGK